MLTETYTNVESGIEAVVTEGNDRHEARVIFRDIDANETISVLFSTWAICIQKAKEFVKG